MARPTVKKQIELPGGGTGAGARALLRLMASTTTNAAGYVAAQNVDVGGARLAVADSTGLLAWDAVRPNSGVSDDVITTPANTVYEVTTALPGGIHLDPEYITVPDQGADVWVQDHLVVPPGDMPRFPYVTADELDAAVVTALGPTRYRHVQSTPASIWLVEHSLGYRPVVSVLDSAGRELEAEINHIDSNALTVSHLFELAGEAECT